MIKNMHIQLNDLVVKSQGNIVSDMDGEKVMMSVHNGKYYNLGVIGGRILDLIGTPIAVEQLVAILMSEYAVEHAECEEHVISFLEQLLEEGLVQTV